MNTMLVSLLTLLAPPVAPVDTLTTLPPLAKICVDIDQRPMMGDPHGPPVACMMDGAVDFPLKHGSCGADCNTHVPADGAAAPKVPMRIDFFCPGVSDVKVLSYELPKQRRVVVARGSTESSLSLPREIRPFSTAEVAASCAKALGGTWPKGGRHANSTKEAETKLEKTIDLFGGCTGSDELRRNRLRIQLTVTCVDRSF